MTSSPPWRTLRGRNVPLLDIPETYYDGLLGAA